MAARIGSGGARRASKHTVIVGSVVLGASIIAAAVIVSGYSRPQAVVASSAPIVGEFDTVRLPVPVQPVAAGTKAKDIRLKSVAFPAHQVPPGAMTSLEGVLDSVTVAAIPANLPLFRENFSLTAQAVNPVLDKIPPGMRAMTIRVDATSAVEGWAGSGSIVDVLLVEKDRSSVIAERVKILSAERSVSPVEGAAMPSVPSTVTLLVTQEQCLAINTAIPLGRIAFALRGTRDEGNWSDSIYTASRLQGALPDSPGDVRGFIAVKEKDASDGGRQYALVDGRWIKTDVIPPGILVESLRGDSDAPR